MALLRRGRSFVELDRPATLGHGIIQVDEGRMSSALAAGEQARRAGRLVRFVPASGAASRMFKELTQLADETPGPTRAGLTQRAAAGDRIAVVGLEFLDRLPELALADELQAHLAQDDQGLDDLREDGDLAAILAAALGPDGLALGRRPKGLLPFHRHADGPRTAFEEHLRESAELVADGDGRCRVHLTVSPEHRSAFEELQVRLVPQLEEHLGCRYEVTFSVQEPKTDTIALGDDDRPFHRADGELLFRPGGHGALLHNLVAPPAVDLLVVKNVDNIQPEDRRGPTITWVRVLVGLLVELERQVHDLVRRIDAGDETAVGEAVALVRDQIGLSLDDAEATDAVAVRWLLARPIRVCGMVPNSGETGGGPFWVRSGDGRVTPQVIETVQVEATIAAQADILASATYFNPVFMVLGLRDHLGRAHDLDAFVDAEAAIVTPKSEGGLSLLALERPGLWNGAMAHWMTVFVEIPETVFAPVKSVVDLLRPEHTMRA